MWEEDKSEKSCRSKTMFYIIISGEKSCHRAIVVVFQNEKKNIDWKLE